MLRGSVLALAGLYAAPALWKALVDHNVGLDVVAVRFLIAVPVAAGLLAWVRLAIRRREQR